MTNVLIGVNNELVPEMREKCEYIAKQILKPAIIEHIYPHESIYTYTKHNYTLPIYDVSILSTSEKQIAHPFDPRILPGTVKKFKSLGDINKTIILGSTIYADKFEMIADKYICLEKGWEKELVKTLDNIL